MSLAVPDFIKHLLLNTVNLRPSAHVFLLFIICSVFCFWSDFQILIKYLTQLAWTSGRRFTECFFKVFNWFSIMLSLKFTELDSSIYIYTYTSVYCSTFIDLFSSFNIFENLSIQRLWYSIWTFTFHVRSCNIFVYVCSFFYFFFLCRFKSFHKSLISRLQGKCICVCHIGSGNRSQHCKGL